MPGSPVLIGLTGTNGAGKGEAAAFFAARGYDVLSLSDVLREILTGAGREASRDNLTALGNALRREEGPDALARRVLEKVRGPSVIDSIRNPAEVAALRRREGFLLLAVDAPAALRFARVRARGRDESASTLEDFRLREDREKSALPEAQQIHLCMAMADATILNDGTLEEFHRRLEAFL